MLVATLEDLQGSVEVVVFPKVFEQTAQSWADDSVVLVTGRIDRRDESPQILCEAVHQWDDAVRMGPMAFGAERDRLLAARAGKWQTAAPGGTVAGGLERHLTHSGGCAAGRSGRRRRCRRARGGRGRRCAQSPPRRRRRRCDAVPIQSAPEVSGRDRERLDRRRGADRAAAGRDRVGQGGACSGGRDRCRSLLTISVAGATRQVRLPDRVAWDERLEETVRRAAGVPVAVELRSGVEERLGLEAPQRNSTLSSSAWMVGKIRSRSIGCEARKSARTSIHRSGKPGGLSCHHTTNTSCV